LRLGPDLEALVRQRPVPLVRCERISRHGAVRETRDTFRLDFEDGVTLKGRSLSSPATARRVEAVVRRLDPARFPMVVARHGAALIEEWIPGEALDRQPVHDAHLRWAAETLGAVHRLPPPLPRPPFWLRARSALLARHLDRLADAGALPRADARRLRDLAWAAAPRDAEHRLIHRDVCPENIVVDPGGRLYCVDNAAARGGAPDEDLARTCYRWPLDARSSEVFLAAYSAFRDPGGFLAHRRFWMVAALSHASWIRHSRGYARADAPLRRLVAELGEADAQVPCSASRTARS
jgi:aminoglycoside phosphotransferase (APT) family kinase protein